MTRRRTVWLALLVGVTTIFTLFPPRTHGEPIVTHYTVSTSHADYGATYNGSNAPRTVVTEAAHLTYYLPTGNATRSGLWPIEGYTVGCGWDVPDGAQVTFANGDTYLCADKGATWEPWIDFFSWSNSTGHALVDMHTEWCTSDGCYALVTFSW